MPDKKPSDAIDVVHAALLKQVERENLKDIADKAGVPYGWLQQFFYRNIGEPGWSKFTLLARYLGVAVEDLSV